MKCPAICGALAMALTAVPTVQACSVCYGDPESSMTRGAVWGVVVLGVIVYGLLMGVAGIGVTWFVKARKLSRAEGVGVERAGMQSRPGAPGSGSGFA